jgi:hypothetical protein
MRRFRKPASAIAYSCRASAGRYVRPSRLLDGRYFRPVPAAGRATQPQGAHALRWRAADGGRQPRAACCPATPWMRSEFSKLIRRIRLRTSAATLGLPPTRTRLPAPIGPEPRSVPSHDRVGLDDDRSVQQRRHKAIEPDKEQSVRCREPWLGGKPAPQQVQLMARNTISASSRACDLKGEANTCSNKPRNETIPRHYPISRAATAWIGFSAGTAGPGPGIAGDETMAR